MDQKILTIIFFFFLYLSLERSAWTDNLREDAREGTGGTDGASNVRAREADDDTVLRRLERVGDDVADGRLGEVLAHESRVDGGRRAEDGSDASPVVAVGGAAGNVEAGVGGVSVEVTDLGGLAVASGRGDGAGAGADGAGLDLRGGGSLGDHDVVEAVGGALGEVDVLVGGVDVEVTNALGGGRRGRGQGRGGDEDRAGGAAVLVAGLAEPVGGIERLASGEEVGGGNGPGSGGRGGVDLVAGRGVHAEGGGGGGLDEGHAEASLGGREGNTVGGGRRGDGRVGGARRDGGGRGLGGAGGGDGGRDELEGPGLGGRLEHDVTGGVDGDHRPGLRGGSGDESEERNSGLHVGEFFSDDLDKS
jgi:hypothetical protein